MKFNAVNNKESGYVLSVSGQCMVAQAWSALLASSRCEFYSVSWRPLSSFGLWIILFILLPPSLSPFIFPLINQCDMCLVPLPWGAHGWNARVYQELACSRRLDSRVRCSDGGERVKSYVASVAGAWSK